MGHIFPSDVHVVFNFILILIFPYQIWCFENLGAYPVCENSTVGVEPSNYTDTQSSITGSLWMLQTAEYRSLCCGTIESWSFVAKATGTIKFVVFRKYSDGQFQIMGVSEHTVSDINSGMTITQASNPKLLIQNGDYIGWYFSSTAVISYSVGGTYAMVKYSTGVSDSDIQRGYIMDWTLHNTARYNILFGVSANIVQGLAPAFTFVTELIIEDVNQKGTTVLDITYWTETPTELGHDVFIEQKLYSSKYFELDNSTLEIRSTSMYIPLGSYTLELYIMDACRRINSTTVNITIIDAPMTTITNLPATYTNLHESIEKEQSLYTVITDDNSTIDTITCELYDIEDHPFHVRKTPYSIKTYDIYVYDWPQFNYDIKSVYELVLACNDTRTTASGTYTVSLYRNDPPTFLNTLWTASVNAEQAKIGDVIFTVSTSDPENDTIWMSISPNPSPSPFLLLSSGELVVNENLLHNDNSVYTLVLTISDSTGRNTVTGQSITVTITNVNDKPVFSNLITNLTVLDNTPLSTSLYTFSVADSDASDTHIFAASYDSGEGASLFELHKTSGLLSTSSWNMIDADNLEDADKTYTMRITVTDGKYFQSATVTLLVVANNAAPFFLQKYYSISTTEGPAGQSLPTPVYRSADLDGDSLTYGLDCGTDTSRFNFTASDGSIAFSADYDLDTAGVPSSLMCTVTVTDGSLSDTAKLAIAVEHVNEYFPSFTQSEYSVYVECATEVFTSVLSIEATEPDSSSTDHGTFYYSINQTNLTAEYFGIKVNGEIYLKQNLTEFCNGTTMVFDAIATDDAGLSSSVNVTVEVVLRTTTTTTTTTEKPFTLFTNAENIYVIIPLALAALVLSILAVGMTLYYIPKAGSAIAEKISEAMREETPPPPDIPEPEDDEVIGRMFRLRHNLANF